VDGLKKLGQSGCVVNSNELMCFVEERELNEELNNCWLLRMDCSA